MATCATGKNRTSGKHRRPGRFERTTARAAGVAAITATGVIGTLAAPALAAEPAAAPEQTGFIPVVAVGSTVADEIDAQAAAQEQSAYEAEALRKAAEEAARKKAAEEAKEKREAEERAAREAERRLLGSFVAPVAGSNLSTSYGTGGSLWSSGSHTGADFTAATGTSVRAVGAGTVVQAGWGGAYGNQVVIRMNDGTYTQYAHMSSLSVSAGQTVTPGRQIGLSGATGNVTGPHLHFEARSTPEYGSDLDPVGYLRSRGVAL
ncbi:peptidase [Streptomyces zinciresistens K42]|uniref:Peptidase n=1 Tax=Streptomyces zinciresistens K42 TaxID=700597 RepID=G2G5I3_9ACTN|nr:M23 family metallopeptidase [Streptomyces zinciresistens]EGX61150.1 peptidase [Streptomyces zinciresistens K42]